MDRKVTLNLLCFKKKLKEDGKAPNTINLYFLRLNPFTRNSNYFTRNYAGYR